MEDAKLYIGLMSGTSMDAVDAVLLAIKDNTPTFDVVAHHSLPMPSGLRESLQLLAAPGADDVHRLGEADVATGKLFAQTALELLNQQHLTPKDITAIGSHGQTIRHYPPSAHGKHPYTVQIGDPSTVAAGTGITTVADFRRKDIALGGEAAPLVPAFHQAVFQSQTLNRAVVNIGGIANVTWLPKASSEASVTGFDTGPGNCLMDGWIERHKNFPYDDRGAWAGRGSSLADALALMLEEPYLQQPPPKSTGKELFNLAWLDKLLDKIPNSRQPADIQATLCEFTVSTIALGLQLITGGKRINEIYICGGGAHNDHLMSLLQEANPKIPVQSTAACGIQPLQVEAAAFAWLAHRTLNHLPGNLPEVTGAQRAAVLGGIYLP